jgi:N-acetylmuramoyl-L-alanine amidase
MNNSNWITTRGQLGIIDYIDCQQTDSDVLKVIIKLKDKYAWGYNVKYIGNSLTIDVKHTPSLDLKDMTIGLDAGHGGENPGAKSATGLTEKDINLDITHRIADLLRQRGAKIVFSREGDTGPSMSERRKIFADANIDLLISTHNNSGGSPLTTMVTSTYYKHVSDRVLAQCMLNRLLELDLKNFGLTGNFNFSLNSPTEYPNVLLEVLFMSSLPEEEKLADPEFRQKVAEKAVLGLEDYLKMVKESL